jgi:phosphoribosylformylglycinamidine synthase subunit PurQ / glutaminase
VIAIPFFPGTNCEKDTEYAVKKLGFDAKVVWHKEESLPEGTKVVIVPGGFSYGDYLRSGAIARFSPVMKAIKTFADNGGHVLGICNGFQILLETGLLPGAMKRNENLHFVSSHEYLQVVDNDNDFLCETDKSTLYSMPVAHAEGNYFCDATTLKAMYANGQVILKYATVDANEKNINGSIDNIAGICNKTKNVFGLMPHPERACEDALGCSDGAMFLSGFLKKVYNRD